MRTAIVLLGQDLRLDDNPAFYDAFTKGFSIVPVYIRDNGTDAPWAIGGASRWWLHQSLIALEKEVRQSGGNLVLRSGPFVDVVEKLVGETDAAAVFWNRRVEPSWREQFDKLSMVLKQKAVAAYVSNGNYLINPTQILSGQGTYYKVFTPFWESAMKEIDPIEKALPTPPSSHFCKKKFASDTIESWNLVEHKINWAEKFTPFWTPGSAGAKKRLDTFVAHELEGYAHGRDFPARDNVSRLSPHLHYGEISPRQVWNALTGSCKESIRKYRAELGWREFSAYLLYHFPKLPEKPFRQEFERFPWKRDFKGLHAWQRGLTGYPIVDAGMRQLWETGWMHNRIRMVVASFLIKDLQIDWQEGEKWFWETLVDADLASNAASWQWVAGSGADAAPYFRIFNPVTQGRDYDPDGTYIRQWIPELAGMPLKHLHAPWEAPLLLQQTNYPLPIVDHAEARKAALANFEQIKKIT